MSWISKCDIVNKLCAASPVLFSGLLVLMTSTLFYYTYFLQLTSNRWHQWPTTSSWGIDETTDDTFRGHPADWETLLEETLALQEKVNAMEKEKKSQTELLANEKELQRQLIATLNEKTKLLQEEQTKVQQRNQTWQLIGQLQKEIEILEANATLHRDFLDYMSDVFQTTYYRGVDTYTRYTVARKGMLPLDGMEPLRPEFGPVINDVLSFQYPLTIPPCQDVTGVDRTVFLAVISGAGNFERRNVTRHLWPKHLKAEQDKGLLGVAGFAFILGKPDKNETQKLIEEESQMYGDVIQIEMVDTYRNLSLKVAALFNWLHTRNCSKVDFLFKVDDDVYVNVRNLAQFVQSQPRHDANLTIFGNSAGSLWPARDGKWGLTYEEWPWQDFPRYFFGPGVLFPGNTILPMLASFQTTPMLHIDDLYYSGVSVERAGIRIRYSTNSTSVHQIGLAAFPAACDLRRFISWLTVSSNHMNNSHTVTEDFYSNRTRCVVAGPKNGTNTTIDYTAPAHFYFL